MSEKPEHDSKTEEATEKRLREAIEKGNVPVSREAGTFASLAACLLASALFLRDEGEAAIALMMGDPNAIPDRLLAAVVKLLAAVALAAGVLAAADLVWACLSWRRELRMTRHEVKEEHKEAEGDPMVKARRRS